MVRSVVIGLSDSRAERQGAKLTLDHAEDPMDAPSVFNFFLPAYSPPGAITEESSMAPPRRAGRSCHETRGSLQSLAAG